MFTAFLIVTNIAAFLIVPVACGLREEERDRVNKVGLIHIYLANLLNYSIVQLI